jgi:regulatory protein
LKRSNPPPEESGRDDEAYQASYAGALRLLARREHSELELRRKLVARKHGEAVVDAVLAELVERGLLSDRRYTDVYLRGRYQRGYGPLRIRAELHERGIGDALLEQPLSELADSWVESAAQQRCKRFGECLPRDYAERARQMRFLQQRGFTAEQIRAAFDSVATECS